jgi:fructuronate reductase
MKLNRKEILDQKENFQKAEIKLPTFDYEKVKEDTKKEPTWLHFGAGNIFRAFPAALQQKLLEEGIEKKGIIVAEGYDYEIIDKLFTPHDNLSLLVTLKANGSIEKNVIGSIVESLRVDEAFAEDKQRLKEIFCSPSLQMVSFTITEKGYQVNKSNGEVIPDIAKDFEAGPKNAKSYLGKLTALCYERYLAGKLPFSLVSMDNCSHNGDKLYAAVDTFAKEWEERKLVEEGFVSYIENPELVAFPWSMIDKITPRPDESVKKMLLEVGFDDVDDVITSKNTYVAPFVNAEEAEYLVIEDAFPNGRPDLTKAGVIFTDKETVDKVEKMKVCTCLNPLHTGLAVFGCLLGYTKISEEMKDMDLVRLVEGLGYVEGLPVVVDPKIMEPKDFIDTVIKVRIPNPFMPDTPQRIATDTSQKLSIRFGETIKAYQKKEGTPIRSLKLIPLVQAAWVRYLLGVNDEGEKFEVSPDPYYEELKNVLDGVELGKSLPQTFQISNILTRKDIFGVDLYEVGLGELVEGYFTKMLEGKGAVRKTLKEALDK